MDKIQYGSVIEVANQLAAVQLFGDSKPYPIGLKFPKGSNITVGDHVVVASVSGTYIIISVY